MVAVVWGAGDLRPRYESLHAPVSLRFGAVPDPGAEGSTALDPGHHPLLRHQTYPVLSGDWPDGRNFKQLLLGVGAARHLGGHEAWRVRDDYHQRNCVRRVLVVLAPPAA